MKQPTTSQNWVDHDANNFIKESIFCLSGFVIDASRLMATFTMKHVHICFNSGYNSGEKMPELWLLFDPRAHVSAPNGGHHISKHSNVQRYLLAADWK